VAPLIHAAFRGSDDFFDGENQILSYVHLPSRLYADAYVGRGFANNAARHWDMTLADNDEHNHRFTEPDRIHG
jgi:hypothetical protein